MAGPGREPWTSGPECQPVNYYVTEHRCRNIDLERILLFLLLKTRFNVFTPKERCGGTTIAHAKSTKLYKKYYVG